MTEPQYFRSEDAGDPVQPNAGVWRKEIHSRVSRFRTRRGRRIEGAFSMRFPFPPAEPVTSTPVVEFDMVSPEHDISGAKVPTAAEFIKSIVSIEELPGAVHASAEHLAEPTPEPAELEATIEPEPTVEPAPAPLPRFEPELPPVIEQRPRPKRKVIAFPRQAGASEAVYRLADPVLPDQPRILDVPEELEAFPSTPFLEGLQFEPAQQTLPVPSEHIELPFRVASRSQRAYSALVDCSLVAAAASVFALICHKILPNLVLSKPVLLTAAATSVLFWGIYQYLFLVYAGRTAGMQVAGLRLSTFQGTRASVRQRRNRVAGLYLSTASLIMGLLWAFVDVDVLCWHDRISGTYLTKRE
jgi:uncharacterized RDD family membrane protein YckC